MSRIASLTPSPTSAASGRRSRWSNRASGVEVEDALGLVGGGVIDAAAAPAPTRRRFSSTARWASKPNLGEAQEDQAEDRAGVSWADVRPELARSWSAASHRRFSSVSVPVSFSDGAIQRKKGLLGGVSDGHSDGHARKAPIPRLVNAVGPCFAPRHQRYAGAGARLRILAHRCAPGRDLPRSQAVAGGSLIAPFSFGVRSSTCTAGGTPPLGGQLVAVE